MVKIRCARAQDEGWVRRLIHGFRLTADLCREAPWDVLVEDTGCIRGGGQVITCGLNRRETVTVSSLLQKGGLAALQRTVRTLQGVEIEPRELSLEGLEGTVEEKLAAVALLVLLGAKN